MKSERTKKDRLRADVLLIAELLVVALGFFAVQRLSRKDGALAVVYVNGERTAEYPLAEDTTVTLYAPNGGYNILVISGGCADVTEASCPDGICVRARPAQYEGDTIVCLPNKTEIRIEGAAPSDVDLLSRDGQDEPSCTACGDDRRSNEPLACGAAAAAGRHSGR